MDSVDSKVLDTPLDSILTGFGLRALKAVNGLGVKTLRELASKTEVDVLMVRGCGNTALHEIRNLLKRYGLSLNMSFPVTQSGMPIPEMASMNLRDYLAAKAMQAYLANADESDDAKDIAEDAYAMADTMIRERSK